MGKLMIEENGVPRLITAADLKEVAAKDVVNRVSAGRGVSAATSWVSRIKPDGSFTTESIVIVDPGLEGFTFSSGSISKAAARSRPTLFFNAAISSASSH